VDIPAPKEQQNPIRFTFLWLEENRWEGKDYGVNLQPKEGADHSRTNVRGRRERGNVATNVG
jgi:hypothetical protein